MMDFDFVYETLIKKINLQGELLTGKLKDLENCQQRLAEILRFVQHDVRELQKVQSSKKS